MVTVIKRALVTPKPLLSVWVTEIFFLSPRPEDLAAGPCPQLEVKSTDDILGTKDSIYFLRLNVTKILSNIIPERVITYLKFLGIIKSCFLSPEIKILSKTVSSYILLRRSSNTCVDLISGSVIRDKIQCSVSLLLWWPQNGKLFYTRKRYHHHHHHHSYPFSPPN